MVLSLASFPEELLARVLVPVLAPPRVADFCPPRNRTAPLLVSRQFLRIASPLLYHTLHIHSQRQAASALGTLSRYPSLASAVRRLVFTGIWPASASVLALCDRVHDVDITLDAGPPHPIPATADINDVDAEAFCHALEQRRSITHLTIRKDPAVYLTHPRPAYVLLRLAKAVHQWTNLETVHFALRISATPATVLLVQALSVAPCLRTVRAQLPAVWNDLLLVISTNPRLEKVMLYTELNLSPRQSRPNQTMASAVIKGGSICDDIEHAVLGTGLYMMEARKHARFSDLIKSGTAIIRTRATTIATLSTSSAGGTPLSVIRAKEVAAELMANMNREIFGSPAAQPFAVTTGRHAQAQIAVA